MVYHILGLMSGSSLDGLDLAYCRFDWQENKVVAWDILAADTLPFSDLWQRRLANLPQQDALIFAKTHTYFGHYIAELVQIFLQKNNLQQVDAIASHGHTIFHDPNRRLTVQIGDGAALAAQTGYTTICDFRTQDVALDGEGAPLAPLVEQHLLGGYDFYLNLGGIANVSAPVDGRWVAFDCCPANQVLNGLAQELGAPYDEAGAWARAGQVLPNLLTQAAQFDFYHQPYPKSLGNGWIQQEVLPLYKAAKGSWQDKLATACEHTAISIADALQQIIEQEQLSKEQPFRVLTTGGGAFNTYLLESIQAYCDRSYNIEIHCPSEELISYKEALLMALLGLLRLEGQPNSLKSVTGAQRNTVNGAVYHGFKS
ncbi:MAG: anhydro-N-acetylmuramic acid kinase [Aureispira sp.]